MAVGDVNQTIYEWRGSAPKYMLSGFEKDFTKVQKYNLSYTFRYGHLLSMMANEVIQYNQQTDESMCFSSMKQVRQTMVEVINKNHLSNFVSTLKDLDKMTEVVILVRRYSSSALFEIACIS